MSRVRIYRNLHKKKMSVQEKVDGKWRVVDWITDCKLTNVTFKVSEPGRQRVISLKKKFVHAYVEGDITEYTEELNTSVSYNPYVNETFVAGNSPIYSADRLEIRDCRLYV